MRALFDWAYHQSIASWAVFSVASNCAIAGASIFACWLIGWMFPQHPLFSEPQPLTGKDKWLATLATLLNASVSQGGWMLWKAGWIKITFPDWPRTLFDAAILLLAMDLGMYALHWAAHLRPLYFWIHRTHHVHVSTNPISLFVLNPFEVLGFGSLLLVALALAPFSATAVIFYLTLNVVFGVLGHAGVEPLPARWLRRPVLRLLGTSTFHGQHHADPTHNFGFYTLIWDRLFGTIHPHYDERFLGSGSSQPLG